MSLFLFLRPPFLRRQVRPGFLLCGRFQKRPRPAVPFLSSFSPLSQSSGQVQGPPFSRLFLKTPPGTLRPGGSAQSSCAGKFFY